MKNSFYHANFTLVQFAPEKEIFLLQLLKKKEKRLLQLQYQSEKSRTDCQRYIHKHAATSTNCNTEINSSIKAKTTKMDINLYVIFHEEKCNLS